MDDLKRIIEDVKTKPVIPLLDAGELLGLGRNATYAAAHNGEIEVVQYGKLIKAVTAPLRKRLGIEAA